MHTDLVIRFHLDRYIFHVSSNIGSCGWFDGYISLLSLQHSHCISIDGGQMRTLESVMENDPELFSYAKKELARQREGLEMIPSENFTSEAVMQAVGSFLTNKYSEGYPGKRYYGGNEFIDGIEMLASSRAKKLFGVPHANVQPYSGSPANLAVYFATCKTGDTIMGQNLTDGGHLTHGWKTSATGQLFRSVPYHVKADGYMDIDEARRLAKENKPKLIWVGSTAYTREFPFEEFSEIAEECGAYLAADMQWLNARDKLSTFITLAKSGIPIPETISTEHMFIAYEAVKRFGKAVIKPLLSAMGYGVFKVEDPDVAMHIFSYLVNINKPMYVQKYIEKKGGGDYRVVVVEGRALGAEFRKGSGWKSNIAQGASPINVENPDKELTELAIKATESLGLDFAGIDIAETEEGYYVLESNPTLSWQGFKKATGINPAEEIVDFLIRKAKR